jgi:hypothetical protein
MFGTWFLDFNCLTSLVGMETEISKGLYGVGTVRCSYVGGDDIDGCGGRCGGGFG